MSARPPAPDLPLAGLLAPAPEIPAEAERFAIELEFVQNLCNPHYLQHLAQNSYFQDPSFVAFLKYLQYWHQPQYAQYITYPHALFFLGLLQSKEFCKELSKTNVIEFIHTQQFRFWQSFANDATKQGAAAGGAAGPGAGVADSGAVQGASAPTAG